MLVNTGADAFTVKAAALEAPPPGDGLVTVTCAVALAAMAAAGTTAVNCVALTKVVASGVVFHKTDDAGRKPLP